MPRSASGQLRDALFAEPADRMEPVSVGHAKNGFAFFIVCMFYSFVTMNIPFVLLYIFLGGVFLFSAYSLWEKDKNNRR